MLNKSIPSALQIAELKEELQDTKSGKSSAASAVPGVDAEHQDASSKGGLGKVNTSWATRLLSVQPEILDKN